MNFFYHTMIRATVMAFAFSIFSQGMKLTAAETAGFGPARGTLILIGGGSERGAGIIETFINRAGGVHAKFVIIPTARGNRTPDGQLKLYTSDEVLGVWKIRGLTNLTMLHTSDRSVADFDDFVKPLREANAVWIDGDDQQALLGSYSNTLTQTELEKVLDRGGVVAGNGAGTTCLGARLLRTEIGATNIAPDAADQPGFALLRHSILDLQINTRNRWHDLEPAILRHSDLLGIGLSETTAIVVTGDRFEVIGKWKVSILDASRAHQPWEISRVVLEPGDVFNMVSRKIERLGDGTLKAPPVNPIQSATQSTNEPTTRDVHLENAKTSLHYGPTNGSLVIVGGGPWTGTGIIEKFVSLAGGFTNARIVVVPTANGNRGPDGQPIIYKEEEVIGAWKSRLGVKNVRMLHTYDTNVANTEEFVRPLREATGVWFDGGRQWNLVDSYKGTLTEKEFKKVLDRGGAVGGTSAGATILGDYLVRGAVAGPDIVMAPEPEHQHGFGLLAHSAIDQHINTRNRWDDLTQVIKKYPDLLGIGLSESTAIIVTGDRFEVMGKWKVAVHDNTRLYEPWEKPYFILQAGDVYNMQTRTIEK